MLADSHEAGTLEELQRRLRGRRSTCYHRRRPSYEGVKSDFQRYAPLLGDVGSNDIVQHPPMRSGEVDASGPEVRESSVPRVVVEPDMGRDRVLFMDEASGGGMSETGTGAQGQDRDLAPSERREYLLRQMYAKLDDPNLAGHAYDHHARSSRGEADGERRGGERGRSPTRRPLRRSAGRARDRG